MSWLDDEERESIERIRDSYNPEESKEAESDWRFYDDMLNNDGRN